MAGEHTERIAIVGAGNVGGNLAVRLVEAGYQVRLGLKPGGDAREVIDRTAGRATAAPAPEAVAGADIVFIALPAAAAVPVARELPLDGKIVVDCTNPLRWDGGPVWAPPAEGSSAAAIAAAAPGAKVVKGFNQFGAEIHLDPKLAAGARANVYLASDDAEAKARVAAVAERAGFSPIDSGPLRNAAVLENLAVLWIHLAMVSGQGRNFALQVVARR
jgi:8-hydroxy-5-deazaflavin:NADPH oxidoreductase